MREYICFYVFFFFNDTATTEIYTLSLHDALPISCRDQEERRVVDRLRRRRARRARVPGKAREGRSEEHTSELQSQSNLVCRLLLEKKKKYHPFISHVVIHYTAHLYDRITIDRDTL